MTNYVKQMITRQLQPQLILVPHQSIYQSLSCVSHFLIFMIQNTVNSPINTFNEQLMHANDIVIEWLPVLAKIVLILGLTKHFWWQNEKPFAKKSREGGSVKHLSGLVLVRTKIFITTAIDFKRPCWEIVCV